MHTKLWLNKLEVTDHLEDTGRGERIMLECYRNRV